MVFFWGGGDDIRIRNNRGGEPAPHLKDSHGGSVPILPLLIL